MSLVLASVLGASQASMMISIIIATVPITFRLIYLRSQELHHEDYVQASIALGCKPIPLIFKHFVPALWDTCRVKIPNLIASGILAEAAISFLGAGAPSGTDTWGSLLAQGRSYMLEAPHIMLSTGLPLVAVLLCLNYLYKS
jgi:ABC-type dipeptide/oligopeptide/nickel transport system permease subunit